MTAQRDYKKEYQEYHSKPDQKKRRAARNKARRLMIKKGKAHKGDGKDVDHKDRNPKNNSLNNLSIKPKSKNRAWRKGKHGY
jgi:hypothetical protein